MNAELLRHPKEIILPTAISVAFYTLHFSENYDKLHIFSNGVLYA